MYSPECRSTWNGISAASGKLGALLGATLFEPAADEWGDPSVMKICSGLAISAFGLTYWFVPTTESENEETPAQPVATSEEVVEEEEQEVVIAESPVESEVLPVSTVDGE